MNQTKHRYPNQKHFIETLEFTHVQSHLKFQYQINNDAHGSMSSVTFFYRLSMPLKIEATTLDDAFKLFYETIEGRLYGGVIIEKYKTEKDVYCYLMHDGRYYKIGKSKNPEKRLKELKTANPSCYLLYKTLNIPESFLHDLFSDKNFSLEWFHLNEGEVTLLRSLMSVNNQNSAKMLMRMSARRIKGNQPTRGEHKEARLLLMKLPFGMHKGRTLKSMKSVDDIGYLVWLKKSMQANGQQQSDLFKGVIVALSTNAYSKS